MSQENEILTLDGSVFEGGGQVLRNCVALSCLLNKSIQIVNIRANRDKPGLRPQHLSGIQLVRDIFQADLQGDKIGSREILFRPEKVGSSKTYIADTKTAGSIALLIQISLLPLVFSAPPPVSHLTLPPRANKVVLKGGTNVNAAPPIDFLIEIFRPIVQREFGFTFDINIIGRGYYPQGGGEVMLRVDPVVGRALNPVKMVDRGTVVNIKGQTSKHYEYTCSGISDPTLPEISGIKPDIEINVEKAVSKGFDLLLWAETSTGCIMSGSAIGSKRQSPEDVGKKAAEELLQNLSHGGCVDEYLQDQLIIFMSLAEGKSQLATGPITMHTRTAIHFAEKMLGIKFQISKLESRQYVKLEDDAPDEAYDGGPFIIECEGVGLKIVNDNAQQTA
ncbi:696_t:CDS:10 [Acaulospora morrowiae]|uniref:RNA 3'-terminal-phosphate cyclase (ATP) n=1 Tax=Acaulospora morrowiae TaxID=94023 RepID=A0A9N8Z4B9_9GLOM|nr:696_t:CDS:10 [Acaulospora morrowiae]